MQALSVLHFGKLIESLTHIAYNVAMIPEKHLKHAQILLIIQWFSLIKKSRTKLETFELSIYFIKNKEPINNKKKYKTSLLK